MVVLMTPAFGEDPAEERAASEVIPRPIEEIFVNPLTGLIFTNVLLITFWWYLRLVANLVFISIQVLTWGILFVSAAFVFIFYTYERRREQLRNISPKLVLNQEDERIGIVNLGNGPAIRIEAETSVQPRGPSKSITGYYIRPDEELVLLDNITRQGDESDEQVESVLVEGIYLDLNENRWQVSEELEIQNPPSGIRRRQLE